MGIRIWGLGFGIFGVRVDLCGSGRSHEARPCGVRPTEALFVIEGLKKDLFSDNLLVQIHLIIEIVLVERPCAMGV